MDLIEIEAKILEGGMIRIPKAELESTGLRKGDEVCLLYLTQSDDNRKNDAKEFIDDAMETKNICGKIPVDLHSKVRTEIEEREISTQQFLQQIIEEHFMKKGVSSMEARTIAVQVTDELFNRLKTVVAWKGCKQKEFLIPVMK